MRPATVQPLPRRTLLILSAGGLVAALAGCRTTDVLPTGDDLSEVQTEGALPIVNTLRQKKGLAGLARKSEAEVAALFQAKRMAKAGKMSHLIGFNDSFLDRMKATEVPLPAAENIATGQDSVERAVQAWIDSKKHLENMLGTYQGLGVAVARHPSSANRPYWAMVLSA
ncbi:MAG: CAP domain-containing protein [Alphaproteobacteria bacterium]|nr:CAP domain-containing protein [Rhizobiaceae bacterium]MBC7149115.1 CAP domain-containing protein [Rhizobium sp.]MBU3964045.1 CAP domain-containing protein [Alphaproteobacteria bacterium]MBU4048241.1 CAP domain-containing protein [Alphaproteobacteria bacterium]MBU4089214.1 CAP domain-containing protein [Alphaproteobacteria bacterium]